MDEDTLLSHRSLWGPETTPTSRELNRLNPEEARLYNDLCTHRFQHHLRLEQERIDFSMVKKALDKILNSESY